MSNNISVRSHMEYILVENVHPFFSNYSRPRSKITQSSQDYSNPNEADKAVTLRSWLGTGRRPHEVRAPATSPRLSVLCE